MTPHALREIAKSVELPKWATHVAVRTDGSKSEPAAWVEKVNDFVDEDPDKNQSKWIGSYKHVYWTFFDRTGLEKSE